MQKDLNVNSEQSQKKPIQTEEITTDPELASSKAEPDGVCPDYEVEFYRLTDENKKLTADNQKLREAVNKLINTMATRYAQDLYKEVLED